MDWTTLLPFAIQAGSGILGYLVGSGKQDQALAILKAAAQKYGSISPPVLEKVAAEVLGPSAMASIQKDPHYAQAQQQALARLNQEAQSGGYTLHDRVAQNQAQDQALQAEHAANSRITEDMAARGVGANSGAAIGLQEQQAQTAAQTASNASMAAAADAQKRAYDAIIQGGQMAGQFGAQDFAQKAQVAQAQDAIARWNAQNKQQTDYYNAYLPQMDYNNRLGLIDKQYGAAKDMAGVISGIGQNQQQSIAGGGNALGNAMNAWNIYNKLGGSKTGTGTDTGSGDMGTGSTGAGTGGYDPAPTPASEIGYEGGGLGAGDLGGGSMGMASAKDPNQQQPTAQAAYEFWQKQKNGAMS